MSTRDLFTLARDLRAVGIPYEPDLTWPLPVRHQSALYVAIGHLCRRIDEARTYEDFATACGLRKRCHEALTWINALGRRSRWGEMGWRFT